MTTEYVTKAFVGKPAPHFTGQALLPDASFGKVSLEDFKGKYLVLFMWPLDHTFVCPTEITQFSDAYEKFKQLDCEIVGCSTDSEYTHKSWVEVPRKLGGLGPVKIPLLADKNHKIAKDYGVLIEEDGVALRGLFIISDTGILRHVTINDLQVGRNVEEVLRLVEAFRYTDKVGEVCAAGWKKNDKGIDTSNAQAYFSKLENAPSH